MWEHPTCGRAMGRRSRLVLDGPGGFHWEQPEKASRRWIWVQILKENFVKSGGCPEKQGSWSPAASTALMGPVESRLWEGDSTRGPGFVTRAKLKGMCAERSREWGSADL